MLRTIVKREFLDNLLSFKFIACVLVAIVLSLTSTAILTRDYQDRLRNYDQGLAAAKEILAQVPVYSALKVKLFRKPSPLSIFVAGVERRAGSYTEITTMEMDIPVSLKGGVAKNEFAAVFSSFDFSSVIVIIFTILAIFLSYDAISGEKEDGLLSLILSNSAPRSKILLGKYLGALVSVAVPLAFCFILGTLYVLFSKNVETNGLFFLSLGSIFAAALLYLSCILLLGLFVSSRTRTSFSSLLLLLGLYIVLSFLVPQAVKSYSANVIARQTRNVETNIENLTNERYKKGDEVLSKFTFKKQWLIPRDAYDMERYGGIILNRISSPEAIENQILVTSRMIPLEKEYARQLYDLKFKDIAAEEGIRNDVHRALAFIPASNFSRIAGLMADTAEDSVSRYLNRVVVYWNLLMRYLDGKDAFGLRFAYPGPDEQTPYEKDMIKKISDDILRLDRDKAVTWTGWHTSYRGKFYEEAVKYRPKLSFLSLDDLPAFDASGLGMAERLRDAWLNIVILVFYNLLFFLLAYFSFARYDPRRID